MINRWANTAEDKQIFYFLNFSQEKGFTISGKVSPKHTICMKCESLFSVE